MYLIYYKDNIDIVHSALHSASSIAHVGACSAHVGACSVSSDGKIQSAEWGDFGLNPAKRGLKTAFPSEQSQSKLEKRPENRSKFSHRFMTDLQRVLKCPSVGAKSVSFAEASPDNQWLSEQNQSVERENRSLTLPSEQIQSADFLSEQNQSRTWQYGMNPASEQIQSLQVCLPLQVKVTFTSRDYGK